MDTMAAFAMGDANRGKPMKVFDWDKAAELIAEGKPRRAAAGLAEDWGSTGGPIYDEEGPVASDDTYTYLASTWATPTLELDGEDIACWRWEKDAGDWNANTYWPESARAILNSANA